MMLTISLTSKADISIYIYKIDYILFFLNILPSFFWWMLAVADCLFFFHTLDFKEPLSLSTRWCFFNDLLCTTIVTRLSQ